MSTTPLDRELSPSAKYIDAAERYLDEAKTDVSNPYGGTSKRSEAGKQTLILGSIAASLIALVKKN